MADRDQVPTAHRSDGDADPRRATVAPAPRDDRRLVARSRAADERVNRITSIPFVAFHLLPFLVVFTGVTARAVVLLVVLYVSRMFFITAGYHRYFAHRSYKLGRVAQFLMAVGGTTALQKGPLWWAAHHRHHHRFSDAEEDLHSPQGGFWWSHVGWFLCDKYSETDLDRIRDFAKYPELVWLNTHDWVAPLALGVVTFLIGGWSGLLLGFFGSTVLLWHGTFTVNSLAHVFGRRRFATEDTSRNSALIALWTLGEGWHNNHHYYQASARQGFFWWELDPSYYMLKRWSWVHVVHELKVPPKSILSSSRIAQGTFDIGMFRKHWRQASHAVLAAQTSIGHVVQDRRADAGESIAARWDIVEEGLASKKESLETFVHNSLEQAEELAKLTRKGQRELRTAEG